MSKNIFYLFLFIIIVLAFLSITDRKHKEKLPMNQEKKQEEDFDEAATPAEIEETYYHQNGVEAYYPKFIAGGSKEQLQLWNEIIEGDIRKILDIYSLQPFPGPTPSPSGQVPTLLRIENKVTLNNNHFFSVFYKASFTSPYSAHPSETVYTTNIDKRAGRRLRLPEELNLDRTFVKDFRSWSFLPFEEGNEELNKAIQDYINNISDEDLLMGFQAADQIGAGNLWGINSYLTPDRLGISLSVPNYAGDHVEFEREYTKILKYLK